MNTSYYKNYLPSLLLLSCLFFLFPSHAFALTADEVVVIANTKANDSLSLAKYYMQQRAIPAENLITIRTTWKESCNREQYQEDIAEPVKEAIQKLQQQKRIRCLVTMYGVPLKIRPPFLDLDDEEQVKQLKQQLSQHQKKSKAAQNNEHSHLKNLIDSLKLQIKLLQQTDTRAAVDSELALVLTDTYPLENWLPNPYFLGFQRQKNLLQRDNVLMVSRLDGPTPDTVRRIIDDSIAVEKTGLQGKAYFDARWPQPDEKKKLSGYALYDAAIHKLGAGRCRISHCQRRMLHFKAGKFTSLVQKDDRGRCGSHSRSCLRAVCAGISHAGYFFQQTDRGLSHPGRSIPDQPAFSFLADGPDRRSTVSAFFP
jgi:uncharacterized protein (TIGR03790 family)